MRGHLFILPGAVRGPVLGMGVGPRGGIRTCQTFMAYPEVWGFIPPILRFFLPMWLIVYLVPLTLNALTNCQVMLRVVHKVFFYHHFVGKCALTLLHGYDAWREYSNVCYGAQPFLVTPERQDLRGFPFER